MMGLRTEAPELWAGIVGWCREIGIDWPEDDIAAVIGKVCSTDLDRLPDDIGRVLEWCRAAERSGDGESVATVEVWRQTPRDLIHITVESDGRVSHGLNVQKTPSIDTKEASDFVGDEDQNDFVSLINQSHNMAAVPRQAAESIQIIAQISYLSLDRRTLTVSLSQEDALNLFEQLSPIGGIPLADGSDEVFRLTDLFQASIDELELNYDATVLSDVEDAGFSGDTAFSEGKKIRKTHLVIERNGKIRTEFFKANPSATCDMCATDTKSHYPWTERVLDVHHLLPLCSGARTSKNGTLLDDLVPLCPTCHRAVHRFYDAWLKDSGKKDFADSQEAKIVYEEAKQRYGTG